MFQINHWPNAILHLDADAFFASIVQAVNPGLKNRPLVVGRERGIVTSLSYEAKTLGIQRGMIIGEVKKSFPQVIISDSDYELYTMFSNRMFAILRNFSPLVEEYSVDEGFADLKGLRRPLSKSYRQIAWSIKQAIEASLNITVSVGVSLTKSLAKLASSFEKPSGLTIVSGPQIETFLKQIPTIKIWGVGANTAAYLEKLNIKTAYDFASKPEGFIKTNMTKPHLEIWHELRGNKLYELNPNEKTTYKSIGKSKTFSPPTSNRPLLWAKLTANIEAAFKKARRFNYQVGTIIIFLKTQDFRYHHTELKLLEKTNYPLLIKKELKNKFNSIYQNQVLYRSTGCCLCNLQDCNSFQPSLFSLNSDPADPDPGPGKQDREARTKTIYSLIETNKIDFGTVLFDPQKHRSLKQPSKFQLPVLSLREGLNP